MIFQRITQFGRRLWDATRLAVMGTDEQPSWFRDKLSGFWFGDAWGWTKSGQAINHETAMRVTTVFQCVRLIAEEAAMLPLKFYRDNPDGSRERVTDSKVERLLKNPNGWQTEMEFREFMFGCLASRGNAYAQITPGREQLIPLHPSRITETELLADGRVRYHIRDKNGREGTLWDFEVLHLKLLTTDGVTGMSPIQYGAEVIGLQMSAVEHGATFFKNASKPGGFVTLKTPLTDDGWEQLSKDVAEFRKPENRHKTPVFAADLDWKAPELLSNKESQWLDSRKFDRADIAALFRVPLHMINDLDGAKFNNMELQDLSLLKHTLMPYLVRFEQRVKHTLIYDDEEDGLPILPEETGLFCEFVAEGLLRGDSKTRSEVNRTALGGPGTGAGWKTVNEIRRMENLPELEDPRADMVYLGETPTEPEPDEDPPPPPPDNEEEEDDDEEEMTALQVLEPMIRDVAGRLAKIEQRNISRRLKHAASDPDGFRAWCEGYYEKHQTIAAKELQYLCEAAGIGEHSEHIAANYCIGRCQDVLDGLTGDARLTIVNADVCARQLRTEITTWTAPDDRTVA